MLQFSALVRRLACAVILISASSRGLAADVVSTPPVYPRAAERAEMLAQIAGLQEQKLQIDFKGQATAAAQNFVEIFRREFWPDAVKMGAMNEKASLLYVAIDRALYNDEAEHQAWETEKDALEKELDRIQTSDARRDVIAKLSNASTGLTGDLAEMARQMYDDQTKFAFTSAELPLLNRLTEVMSAIKTIANQSPVSQMLGAAARESEIIQKKFISKEISFEDAAGQLEALAPRSHGALGQYVALNAKDLLNEAAIIRTKLAKTKGFATWADFELSKKARLYADGYKWVGDRVAFLRNLLASTRATHKAFLEQRARELDGVPEAVRQNIMNLRGAQSTLFAPPTESLISEYFPVENVEAVWKKTMLESGFTPTAVDRIHTDSYPRENKQSHAYMATVRSHQPLTFQIDARTTNVKTPRQVAGEWMPALIYIVQNMRKDGPDAYSTAWHEGGHGLDYSHRQDVLGLGQDSSYSETHSMTMEKFFDDLDFLLSLGKTKDGVPLSREKAEEFLANTAANRLSSLRGQSMNSLYDLELWNHAYEEGGEEFVTRATRLATELAREYMFIDPTVAVNGVDGRYGRFATDHFYGGQVRYIGYVFAEMAAEMSYERLLDVLEKSTGRRTLLNQPEIARLLIEGYYKQGFAKPFPTATEDFAGKKFDAREMAGLVNAGVDAWVKSRSNAGGTCEGLFKPAMSF